VADPALHNDNSNNGNSTQFSQIEKTYTLVFIYVEMTDINIIVLSFNTSHFNICTA
jgi:hypothetical protein